jgi:hypothetical protein
MDSIVKGGKVQFALKINKFILVGICYVLKKKRKKKKKKSRDLL